MAPGGAAPYATGAMNLGAPVAAPIGYLTFCVRRPDQCDAANGEPAKDSAAIANLIQTQPSSTSADFTPASISSAKSAQSASVVKAAAGPGLDLRLRSALQPAPVSVQPLSVAALELGWAQRGGRWTALNAVGPRDCVFLSMRAMFDPTTDAEHAPSLGPSLAQASDARQPVSEPAASTAAPSATLTISPTAPSLARADQGLLTVDAASWSMLQVVNSRINDAIRPMTDEQAFGVSNYWTLPLSEGPRPVGNCKHYALEKRKALVEAGVPAAALSMAIVRTHEGELHAILLVATDHGELVLDNLTPKIVGWNAAPYSWLARQRPGHPLKWVAVGGHV